MDLHQIDLMANEDQWKLKERWCDELSKIYCDEMSYLEAMSWVYHVDSRMIFL